MLAVYEHAGDIGCGYASVKEEAAGLWLASRSSESGNIVGTVVSKLAGEGENSVVAGDEDIVAAIVQELDGVAGAVHETYYSAANGEP